MHSSAPAASALPALSEAARRNFAVIIPAYNEAENMPDLVRELRSVFQRFDLQGDVILVDDGTTDGTAAAAAAAARGWDRFRVVSHRRNFGKTEALLTGAEASEAEWLVLY
ncbi:MAG: glycosyltransferase, partial [Gemmatimonadetes bacterium]|nr:glycosyltransferase [Gemmatimonadota bacterium]